MNAIALSFLLANAAALLLLPRRWALAPLIVGVCYMTLGQRLELGPFTFTVIRILVAVGVLRIFVRGERIVGGLNALDALMIAWAVWACVSGIFYDDINAAVVFRVGLVYNACGIYFLVRVFCSSMDDVVRVCRFTALLLVPVALEMIYEKTALRNLFSVFGGISEEPFVREGRVRAIGPFAHPILAGTVAATSLPLMAGIRGVYPLTALVGALACVCMVVASASSGPVLTAAFSVGALLMWRFQGRMHYFQWLAALAYLVLAIVMQAPVYYLMGRIDLVGGSTGWYRARLIESAFEHLGEWWLTGTNYTRHWMPSGVEWSPNHSDITNHYLQMGVIGGLPLMVLLIAILTKAFSFVGARLRNERDASPNNGFVLWAMGCALFGHAATFLSISYFDQSFVFLYVTLGAIASVGHQLPNPPALRERPAGVISSRRGSLSRAESFGAAVANRRPSRHNHPTGDPATITRDVLYGGGRTMPRSVAEGEYRNRVSGKK